MSTFDDFMINQKVKDGEELNRLRQQLEQERAKNAALEKKMSTIMRMVDIAEQVTDAQSEQEVAASASFNEALALTTLELTEAERDEARATVAALRQRCDRLTGALRPCFHALRKFSPASSIKPNEKEVFAALDLLRAALAPDAGSGATDGQGGAKP